MQVPKLHVPSVDTRKNYPFTYSTYSTYSRYLLARAHTCTTVDDTSRVQASFWFQVAK